MKCRTTTERLKVGHRQSHANSSLLEVHTETLLSLCVSVQPEKREQPTGRG